MFHLARTTALADLRRAPGRFLAVTALLVVAIGLPAAIDAGPVLGFLLAVVIASAATAGAVAIEGSRTETLAANGAGAFSRTLIAASPVALSGLAAAIVGIAIGIARGGPDPVAAIVLGLIVPFMASLVIAWADAPAERVHAGRVTVVLLLAVMLAPTVILPLVLLAGLLSPRLGRTSRALQISAAVAAALAAVGAAVVFGFSETFGDLGLLMLAAAVPLSLGIGWLGAVVVDAVARAAARTGATGRLAATPLTSRTRHVGPIAAATALVVTLAAAEALVGPSFGAREALRPPAEVLGQAGWADDQMIIPVAGAEPAATRSAAAEAISNEPVQAAVIERLDGGGTETLPGYTEDDLGDFLDFRGVLLESPATAVAADGGPTWVGVVSSDDLAALGLADHADALDAGDALVLNPEVADQSGTVSITRTAAPGQALEVPAVAVSPTTPLGLPAVLISEARADELGGVRNAARIVLSPTAEGHRSDVGQAAFRIDVAALPSTDVPGFEHVLGPSLGAGPWWSDQELTGPTIARLNAVPGLAGERDVGQGRALVLAALALLVGLAGTMLVASGGRSDDAVLLVQGAPGSFRVRVAAIRTGIVTLGATVTGLVVGLGVPLLAIAVYNAGERDPSLLDIPVEVSWPALALIGVLPVVAALLAAGVAASQRRTTSDTLAEAALR